MSLLELQRRFHDHLRGAPSAVSDFLSPHADAGLAIYHNAYRRQLIACLGETYETVMAWLGVAAFEAAAIRHIELHPPQSWTLNDYGSQFAATLGELHPEEHELVDLARLEWGLRRAFDGPDARPVSVGELAELDWDRACLGFVPTLRLIRVTTNACALFKAIAERGSPPAPMRLSSPVVVRVWRKYLEPQFATMEPLEALLLDLALKGASFGQICAHLGDTLEEDEAGQRAGEILAKWLQDDLVQSVRS